MVFMLRMNKKYLPLFAYGIGLIAAAALQFYGQDYLKQCALFLGTFIASCLWFFHSAGDTILVWFSLVLRIILQSAVMVSGASMIVVSYALGKAERYYLDLFSLYGLLDVGLYSFAIYCITTLYLLGYCSLVIWSIDDIYGKPTSYLGKAVSGLMCAGAISVGLGALYYVFWLFL